jgi:tetratricopeptide (TPR) repeat protein
VENRYLSLQGNRWLPLNKVLTARSYGDIGGELDLLYAQGWMLVHYLANSKERSGQLRTYLTAINAGQSYEQAMNSAFGPGAKELDSELRSYSSRERLTMVSLPFKPINVGNISVRNLSPAEDALIEYDIALGSGVLKRTAGKFVGSVRKAASPFPQDAYALQILTEAERSAGNNAEAAQSVERWLAVSPGNGLALMHKGQLQIEALRTAKSPDAEAWNRARQPILAANKALPGNPQILLAYYDSFVAQGVLPPAGAQNGLVAAFEALPQDSGIRYQLASDFEQRGMLEEAIAVIKPAAFELHGDEANPKKKKKQEEEREKYRQVGDDSTETARDMLARLEKKLAANGRAPG